MNLKIKGLLIFLILLTPTFCFAKTIKVDRTYYDVNDVLELDGLKYYADTDELIIENGDFISIHSDNDLNIMVLGENNFHNDRSMSSCLKGKNVKIRGSGSLNLISNSGGISADNLEINDVNITFDTKTTSIILFGESSILKFDNTNITSKSNGEMIYTSGDVYLNNSLFNINYCSNFISNFNKIFLNESELTMYFNSKIDLDKIELTNSYLMFSNDNQNYHDDYLDDDLYLKSIIRKEEIIESEEDLSEEIFDDNESISNDNIEDIIFAESNIETINDNSSSFEIVPSEENNSLSDFDFNELQNNDLSNNNYNINKELLDNSNLIENNNISSELLDNNNLIENNNKNLEVSNDSNKNIVKNTKTISSNISNLNKYFSLFMYYIGGILFYLVTKRRIHG